MSISKVRLPNNTEEDIKAKYLIQSTSSDATSAEFSARTITEDAIANIQKIYGNTIKWNQLVPYGANGSSNGTLSKSGNSYTISYTTTSSTKYFYFMFSPYIPAQAHVYYIAFDYVAVSGSPLSVWTKANNNATTISESYSSSKRHYSYIDSNKVAGGTLIVGATFTDVGLSVLGTFSNIMCIDLTAIYGSGNEPTVSEFEAQYPAEYYPYTLPTLLSNSATSIQSKDSNNNVIGNCDLNIPTLTGKLNGTGSSVVIFPDGLKKAGVIQDEVSATATKRVMGIDLGALTWSYNSTLQCFRARNITGMVYTSTNNCICAPYVSVTNSEFQLGTDKAVTISARSIFGDGTADIAIRDTSYGSNYSNFKTAMDGVYLYAEMATPEEYILDNALQLQYPVVAGGTEMVLPTTGTAPMKMDVIYGNAADATSNLSSNFISVDSMKAFLNNLGIQMGGTWNMQYNNGKFEFTFSSS